MTADTATAPRYDRWKAPASDGGTLIWPPPAELLRDSVENHRKLSSASGVLMQGVPLSEVRRRMRQWLGHGDDAVPLVVTGHQAELHHPGVWAKNVLINAAAKRLGGRAMHFAVDTDEPKHLTLRWPGGSVPLSDPDTAPAEWTGLVPVPSPAHLHKVEIAFKQAAKNWNFQPLVPAFLQFMRRAALDSPNLPNALTNCVHELDWSLGLRHDALLVSPMCLSEPYLLFVHYVCSRADEFAANYNKVLDEFRQENKIRTPGRPMPNLKCVAEGCEVPFWLDDLTTGTRTRAAVLRDGRGFSIRLHNGERFHLDPAADGWRAAGNLMQFLRRHGARLSPRALTLTSVLRLLVADQFVHGIGGGQYDQVLDKLISRQFNLTPPRFSVTTATLFFPSAVGQSRVCVPCVSQDGHRLRHAILGEEKMQMVGAIAAAPRRSRERSAMFFEMHDKLADARSRDAFRQWEREYEQARANEQAEKALFDRELFYAIQPGERLRGMIETYERAFG